VGLDVYETYATGRRKRATATARMYQYPKEMTSPDLVPDFLHVITINGKFVDQYFSSLEHMQIVKKPMILTETHNKITVDVRVHGGGLSGQAQAISLAISKTLAKFLPSTKVLLHEAGLLATDPRRVERKHFGRKKARRGFQFSKR
jgi:small subunit ribosomal protein S9